MKFLHGAAENPKQIQTGKIQMSKSDPCCCRVM